MNHVIELKHIDVRRQGRKILDDISLNVDEKESVAIIGANGAGKSTLVDVMCEKIHPIYQERSVRLLFSRSSWNILELQKRMGIVSQSLLSLLSTNYHVQEVVLSGFFSSIGLDFHHQVQQWMLRRVDQILEEFHILHLKERLVGTLSAGERAKVLLARALVHDPSLMLLDEGNANLDLPSKRDYIDQLSACMDKGKSLILVTHDISLILPAIERVIVLREGKILADGPKQDVLRESILSEAYGTNVYVSEREGRFTAWC